jgi:hypothetical protein
MDLMRRAGSSLWAITGMVASAFITYANRKLASA